ncbi:thiol-disulfide oxidoreductase DCC family protein [Undibacterium sp. TJN19]|uniref:thiol-disulfide oxidoreductase DCC family protein n=1 Tax=Undibacterium sp. TJN19 TaxID=3413055 RepID=UPI003BF22E03
MTNYPLTLLYDESCPVCKLEMDNLKARNTRGLLKFIDASASDFDASPYGISQKEMMRVIYAVKPDGSLVHSTEAIRLAYAAVGLGWLTSASGWPVLKPVFDWAYLRLANNRHLLSDKLSGLILLIAAKRAERRSRACKDGACPIKK